MRNTSMTDPKSQLHHAPSLSNSRIILTDSDLIGRDIKAWNLGKVEPFQTITSLNMGLSMVKNRSWSWETVTYFQLGWLTLDILYYPSPAAVCANLIPAAIDSSAREWQNPNHFSKVTSQCYSARYNLFLLLHSRESKWSLFPASTIVGLLTSRDSILSKSSSNCVVAWASRPRRCRTRTCASVLLTTNDLLLNWSSDRYSSVLISFLTWTRRGSSTCLDARQPSAK